VEYKWLNGLRDGGLVSYIYIWRGKRAEFGEGRMEERIRERNAEKHTGI
jgi:hypothetical protein